MRPDETLLVVRTLGQGRRLEIMTMLLGGELCVLDITARLNTSQAATSHLLQGLRLTGLVAVRRDGKRSYYSITSRGSRVMNTPLAELMNGGE